MKIEKLKITLNSRGSQSYNMEWDSSESTCIYDEVAKNY